MKIKYLVSAAAMVIAVTIGLVCYKSFHAVQVPDPKILTPELIVKVIGSDEFSKLPLGVKKQYLDKIPPPEPGRGGGIFARGQNLSEQEKNNLRENMRPNFENMMKKKVDEYFALPPEKKEEYLDQEVARMEEMRKSMPGGDSPGNRPPRHKPSAQEIKNRIETTDPVTKAKMHQFFKEVRQRMEQQKQK